VFEEKEPKLFVSDDGVRKSLLLKRFPKPTAEIVRHLIDPVKPPALLVRS
jgi:hypothetical protein